MLDREIDRTLIEVYQESGWICINKDMVYHILINPNDNYEVFFDRDLFKFLLNRNYKKSIIYHNGYTKRYILLSELERYTFTTCRKDFEFKEKCADFARGGKENYHFFVKFETKDEDMMFKLAYG